TVYDLAGDMAEEPGGGAVWEFILTELPFVREKHLWSDVWADLEAVYRKGTIQQMKAAMEYAELRYKFFDYLEENRRNLRHVNTYEMLMAQTWYLRLQDKIEVSKRGRVKADRGWIKDKVPRKVIHKWAN
ncbi:MAG: hypothetical protein ACXW13_00165, partial [Burkholderiaceae bacterium]